MGDKEKEENNLSLPKATVAKLIKEILPEDVKCSNETRDLILECCVEFIHLISSEANDICLKDGKRMIDAKHVITALDELGFNGYTPKVTETYDKHKEEASSKPSRSARKFENLSKTEMLQEQQRLFAAARDAYQQQQPPSQSTEQQQQSGAPPSLQQPPPPQ
ncbi:putative histone-like transcription factor [Cavenderia fasciculata]|uniref:Histone-like transcription factor n=1 Tax=Cavenderia fasciculata TaxID=261658 RepID=F4QEA3_CACFS|nr:putative histone-like transcription factor [Cavenderia fasciculata]EGG14050.1 putative histone-like transcription factor [Cavenderia fasciculata]|eukprot:XP_004350758.1 putative histone-like transcription factor [Cavenderia fasciculata]